MDDPDKARDIEPHISFLEKLKGLELPHPLIILFFIIILSAALTYLIPGGRFERRAEPGSGRMLVVPGSYQSIPHQPQGLGQLALVPFKGMKEAADIIILLLIIGGAFSIIKDTGSLNAGIYRITQTLKGKEVIMIPLLMTLFALGGSTFGMYEEVLPFVGLIVPMIVAAGYDSIVGVATVYLATTLGFCGAVYNPFTVSIAQNIAGLPPFSGAEYRKVVWLVMLLTGVIYVLIYAAKIRRNPKSSACWKSDEEIRKRLDCADAGLYCMHARHAVTIAVLLAGFVLIPVGVNKWEWRIPELAGLFFSLGILAGIISGTGLSRMVESFLTGASEMINAAFLIGVARGVMLMLENGQVMDTILYSLSSLVSQFPKLVAVQIMFLVQCVLNCFIQSGSAQAAVSMPIMAPLADILGISRQTAVLAFQLGDGFTNFAIPWNGITLAVLNLAGVPIWAWFRWAWRLQAWLIIVCMLLLVWPTLTHWGPF